jgi:hypothetical protein
MKRKSLLVLIGSVCLALVLVALPFVGACTGPEGPTDQEPSETAAPSPEAETSPCEEFINVFEKEGVTITSATTVAATDTVPEHCEIIGKIDTDSIGFAVELPTDWNGRFYMVGNGVYAGNIEYAAMEIGLSMGYATASTDTGHDTSADPMGMLDASFAYNNPEGEIDYCYRAIHETAVTAKEIIEAYYGEPPSYSYFVGCSTGGRQGLMEAQRFPTDFDGIVVGAPVLDFSGTMLWGIWNAEALLGDGNIPVESLPILADAVYEKCDGIDGLVDGLINDPRECTFDPATDLPPGSFTPAQVEALEKIYSDVKNSEGELLYPGTPLGAEVFAAGMMGPASGWAMWIIGIGGPSLQLLIGDSFMKYMAFEVDPGPDYDWTTFSFDTDPQKMAYISSILDATDPDLSEFKAHGGKIIHYHGWADTALNPLMSVNYYESVLNFMGAEETMDFYRLYMVPGMFHCGGGAGCDIVDWFTALVSWVEDGIAPEGLIGSHIEGGEVVRTRPLYPYPGVAVYTGSGSIDDAANFTCSGCE